MPHQSVSVETSSHVTSPTREKLVWVNKQNPVRVYLKMGVSF